MKRRELFKTTGLLCLIPIIPKGKVYTKKELQKKYNRKYDKVVYEDKLLNLSVLKINYLKETQLGFNFKTEILKKFDKIKNTKYFKEVKA